MIIIITITIVIVAFTAIDEKKSVEFINNNIESTVVKCKKTLKAEKTDISTLKMCKKIVKNEGMKVDFFSAYTDILVFRFHYINIIAFLLLIVPSLYGVCKKLKYQYIKNALTRQKYRTFIKELLCESYKYIWLLPLIAIIIMLAVSTYSSFDPTYAITNNTVVWSEQLINNPLIFILLYLINILFHSFFFVNLSLVVAKKHNKFIPCIILSFLLYIALELILEAGVSMIIFNMIFKSDFGIIFNIMNLFMFNTVFGVFPLLLFSFSVMCISFIILYMAYHDEEKVVMSCEKNI